MVEEKVIGQFIIEHPKIGRRRLAKERLRDHKNLDFEIRSVPQFVMDVMGTKYLVMHGHQIQGWAGNPYYGFDRKVGKEAHKRMGIIEKYREMVRFDKMLTGHFHVPANMPEWMVGGSLSGTDAYDHKFGRYSLPMQTGWFVHPEHGEFDWTRFTLNKDML